MTDLEKLLAIEEIRQLRPKYFRVIDAKEFDQLEELFTPDAWFDSQDAVKDPIKGQYPGFPIAPLSRGQGRGGPGNHRRAASGAAKLPYGPHRGD